MVRLRLQRRQHLGVDLLRVHVRGQLSRLRCRAFTLGEAVDVKGSYSRQVLLEAEVEGLADGADDFLGQPVRTLQDHLLGVSWLGVFSDGGPLTCLQSGVIRLRLLVEMFRLMDMPANCRLLFPKMLDRAFEGG
ncbi:hypothetical protein EYF80_007889 [Liparis tanakae]|uniref:Uncharacterized protein n=1 Tax=Liparis tanakae TaxID=230148 RepID=A0A4Z2IUV8_9TELE|nr:hypothetical protein EYF80_007889 [Liparis tanakae]